MNFQKKSKNKRFSKRKKINLYIYKKMTQIIIGEDI